MLGNPYCRRLAATVSLVALTLACSKQTADDHFLKANTYVEQARFREAVIEYRSALQIDPKRGDVRLKLADVYMGLGELREALGESVRAADLLPKDVSAQLRAGNLLLRAGFFEDAKSRANAAAALDSKNSEALVLRGNALAGLKDLDGALSEFQEAIALNPADELAYQSLAGVLRVRGQGVEAEAAFRSAIEVAPKSVSARMGLANYLWAQGRLPEAEAILKAALALDPVNLSTNRALAVLYLASGRQQDAAPFFQTIADTAKTSEALLSLADYYAGLKRYDDSAKVLHDVAAMPEANAAAQTRLAAIDAHNGQRAQALAKLRDIIAQHPKEMTARLLLAQLLVADGKSDQALAEATAIVRDEPTASVAGATYLLIGAINAATDRIEDAIKAYQEVLKGDPQSVAANVALSSLHLSTGSLDKATTYARAALATRPGNALALAMMVRIQLVQLDIEGAKATLLPLVTAFPKAPVVLNLTAAVQLAEHKVEAARASYNAALAISPTDIEATMGLVLIDLDAGRTKDALNRIDVGLKTAGQNANFLVLAARTYGSAGQPEKAEELLKQAIEAAPARLPAYTLLGRFYASRRRLDEAADQFQAIVERNPKSIAAGTMLGMIREAQGRGPDAEKQYQAVLSIDPRAPVAANNLAWIYVSSGRNLDQAMQLARSALQQIPEDPHANDTLGWIYYRKNMHPLAVRHLELSVNNDPNNPNSHYHLGMAYLASDDSVKAKKALQRALTLQPDFDGAEEARKALAQIK